MDILDNKIPYYLNLIYFLKFLIIALKMNELEAKMRIFQNPDLDVEDIA